MGMTRTRAKEMRKVMMTRMMRDRTMMMRRMVTMAYFAGLEWNAAGYSYSGPLYRTVWIITCLRDHLVSVRVVIGEGSNYEKQV
jgi:hypothetical protein